MRILALAVFISAALSAQNTSTQLRPIGHFKFPLGKGFYAVTWTTGNAMANKPDNINLFSGVGYGTRSWWLETMIQKQWNRAGGRTFLDFRFYSTLPAKMDVYLETAPVINGRGLYETWTLQRKVGRGFWAGLESENFHQPGRDVLAAGLRASYVPPAFKSKSYQPVIGVAWYPFHRHRVGEGQGVPMGPTVRIYSILHWKVFGRRRLFR